MKIQEQSGNPFKVASTASESTKAANDSRVEYTYRSQTGFLKDISERRQYDEQGHVITYECYNPDGRLTERSEYEYDENGNQTIWRHYDSQDRMIDRAEYEYDENGNQTLARYFDEHGLMTFGEKYVRDEKGQLISVQQIDGQYSE